MLLLFERERYISDETDFGINSVIKLETTVISNTFLITSSYFAHSCPENNTSHEEQYVHDLRISSLL